MDDAAPHPLTDHDWGRLEGCTTMAAMRPATAIVVLILLALIVAAAVFQAVELLSPPASVPNQVPG